MTQQEERGTTGVVSRVTPEVPGTLRAVALGSAIGAVAALAGVGGALALSGHSASFALGVGGMAAFWGGLGFGSMLGGTVHLVRHSDELEARTRAARLARREIAAAAPDLQAGGGARLEDDRAEPAPTRTSVRAVPQQVH